MINKDFDTITVSDDIENLTGIGEEILVDSDGYIRARFINGMLVDDMYDVIVGNSDVTKF